MTVNAFIHNQRRRHRHTGTQARTSRSAKPRSCERGSMMVTLVPGTKEANNPTIQPARLQERFRGKTRIHSIRPTTRSQHVASSKGLQRQRAWECGLHRCMKPSAAAHHQPRRRQDFGCGRYQSGCMSSVRACRAVAGRLMRRSWRRVVSSKSNRLADFDRTSDVID